MVIEYYQSSADGGKLVGPSSIKTRFL